MSGTGRVLWAGLGWLAFGLGWVGVFLPGLPTTIFWIIAALAFLRTNRRMYERIVRHRRFGPGVRLFVEEGRISRPGKAVSIGAMMGFAALGALAIPPLWVKLLVLGAASAGSLWVALLPTPERSAPGLGPAEAEPGGPRLTSGGDTRD
ncbi:MAG: YbaN family protein [Spirochaetaceae bacterium]|nr:YbaN family protein [Spirochaetaceae bacterium]